MKPASIVLPAFLAACITAAAAQSAWRLPDEAQSFEIARDITAGGIPMRLSGFVSALPPPALAERFRQSLGEPLVETKMKTPRAHGIVLGRMQRDGYLTVQIEAAGSGARGIIAMSDLNNSSARRRKALEDGRRWQARLPAGTRILSDIRSRDGDRLWHQLVLSNALTPEGNRAVLERLMREDGMQLAHQAARASGQSLLFAGPGREATASILRSADGASAIVLDIVQLPGAGQ